MIEKDEKSFTIWTKFPKLHELHKVRVKDNGKKLIKLTFQPFSTLFTL